ncbi:MAG: hypothetical protein BAA04_05335 [Firmicutes bacterium ZCTH02-B6]|nr:MAG: hypothetical protein BAA04_05335 [Firmicutes bacterium ZCTH02-B6]
MGTAVATDRTNLEEARLAEVKNKFLELLETERSSPEFLARYREVDAALSELVSRLTESRR